MTTIVQSIGLKGLEGYKVKVQVMPGKESVCIVGLPDACLKESKERVIGALYIKQGNAGEYLLITWSFYSY
ncbi:hypothetical protein [Terrilactibacillus laevilacticus]|uniref:hypothetical protein n=1 Tax=Terrilactibacillus laevilacticus TaxID=1380157 RepID=UPI003CCC79BC